MLTKADFQNAILDIVPKYPDVAAHYRAGDPRIIQHLDAMATMMAMLSANIELSVDEVFEKVRDTTVLADASIRGIIRKANPGRVRITLTNNSDAEYSLVANRNLFDTNGNIYRIDTPVTVAASATGVFDATQVSSETITHTVTNTVPFYPIEIPDPGNGSFLSSLVVKDEIGEFDYREMYVNIGVGDRVYHVEADDRQRVYVRFGQSNVVGYQPADGQVITLIVNRSVGTITPKANAPFSLEYTLSEQESQLDFKLNAILDVGLSPVGIPVLRELIKYPSIYDHNAVYLAEFDALVQRRYPDAKFLSIWNETKEEAVRGASVDNINCLFVAVLSATGSEAVLTEVNPASPVAPNAIAEINLTAVQKSIRDIILAADSSYKVKFYTPVRSQIVMTVTAEISTSYSATDVQAQIKDLILAEYGQASAAARKKTNKPLYKQIYKLLRENVEALSFGQSDIQVSITAYAGIFRPELWRYVSTTSLTVTVTTANITQSGWG